MPSPEEFVRFIRCDHFRQRPCLPVERLILCLKKLLRVRRSPSLPGVLQTAQLRAFLNLSLPEEAGRAVVVVSPPSATIFLARYSVSLLVCHVCQQELRQLSTARPIGPCGAGDLLHDRAEFTRQIFLQPVDENCLVDSSAAVQSWFRAAANSFGEGAY